MNRIIKNIVPVCILIATILACKLPISATPSPEDVENQAGTAVAATLTAMSPEPHGDVTLEPTREIEITSTSLPAPTETPIPDVSVLRFAYTDRDWNLWTWQEGSSPNQIIASGDVDRVALSSDGEWIAFSRVTADFLETSLWAIRFDGSEERLLINHIRLYGNAPQL